MEAVKRKKALTILVSWLEATKTPHQICNGDPSVDMTIGSTPFLLQEEDLEISTPIPEDGLPAFWRITERCGVGKPTPKFRPQVSGALLPHEDNDLVAMRHTEFRRVPNNPQVFLREDYQKIVSWAVSRFFRFNRPQLKQLGYEPEDLRTFAWLYVMNFHGLWRDIHASDRQNGSSLCNYLQQRFFTDFRRLIDRKCENVLIDQETASIAIGFEVVNQWDPGEDGRHTQVAIPTKPPDDLAEEFEALPPRIQMAKLVRVMAKTRGADVRREAEGRLIRLPNLTPPAKRQIYKFHLEHLPPMTTEERSVHTQNCDRCRLKPPSGL